MSNDKLYEKTNQEPRSFKVKRTTLNGLGQLLRLDESTPARKALSAFLRPCVRRPGRPK